MRKFGVATTRTVDDIYTKEKLVEIDKVERNAKSLTGFIFQALIRVSHRLTRVRHFFLWYSPHNRR